MKILVTGGAGFLGSYLCDRLIKEEHRVICVDNLLTGSEDNISHLKNIPKFKFIKHDVCKKLPENLVADQVYHLASPASPNIHSPKSYHALAFETMLVNTIGTWNLCEFALKNKAKFLFASTSEVYGNPLEHPQKESYRGNVLTTSPRSVYDESKRFGETITSAFVRSKKLNGRIIRVFNTYGPRMAWDDGRVVMEFIKAAFENKPLPIFGTGKQTRSFCYVDDLVEGIILAMNKKNTSGGVFNLGNPEEFTILELAKIIIKLTKTRSKIYYAEKLPMDDPLQRCPGIKKAKNILNWEPQVSLEEGLKKLISYFRELSKINI